MLRKLGWFLVAGAGAAGWGVLALHRGETIGAAWIVIAAVGTYLTAYRVYNRFRGAAGGDSQVADRQMLHAGRLVFRNVAGEVVDLRAPLPDDMQAAWRELSEATP